MATRRHEALMPLTHDHHHALAKARLLRQAAGGDLGERLERAREFVTFFEGDALLHFREEEELLFPLMAEHLENRDLLLRALSEHMDIHRRVLRLRQGLAAGEVPGAELAGLGELLAAHVRVEEKEIFPLAERVVPADALQHLSFEVRHR